MPYLEPNLALFRTQRKSKEIMNSKLAILIGIMARDIKYKDGLGNSSVS